MLPDVFLKVAFAVFKEEIQIIGSFFYIQELNNIGVLQTLQGLVLFLDSIDEVIETGLEYFFDVLLLNDLAGVGLVVVFIFVSLIGGSKPSSAQALIHFDDITAHLLVLLLHINILIPKTTTLFKRPHQSQRLDRTGKEFQKLLIMASNQQKIHIKNTFKTQRKYLLPLYTKNQQKNTKESLQKTTRIEHSAPSQKGQQERVITLNIFNDFFDRLNNEKSRKNPLQPLPQIFKKRSLSVNISEHGALKSINRLQAKRGGKATKIETQISQQSPWQDLESRSKITLIYQPLLGRRHTNNPSPIPHQSQAVITPKAPSDLKDETSVIYYKHPLHQKCIKKQVLHTDPPLFTGKIRNQSIKIQRHLTKVQRVKNNKKRFVKVCNAIIFIHYLKRYSRLYRAFRQKFMFELTIQRIKDEVSKFRQCLWVQLNDFSSVLFEKRHVNFMITKRDSEVLTAKKINYMNMFLMSLCNSLQMAFRQLHSTKMMELIYHLCKHGCYSIGENLLTEAELDLACLSETEGYIRCDKSLQKSSILSLLLIKIVLYSTLLKPHTMAYKYTLGDNEYFESNIKLVGNIIYRIITKIQRKAIKHAGDTYQMGNWHRLRTKFIIKTTKSLTIKQGFYQKGLISGLIDEKAIQQAYCNPEWSEIEVILQRIVESVHEKMRQFHLKCRKTCF